MNPGKLAIISSGETSPTGGTLFRKITAGLPRGFRIALVETPAGFEPNSAQVARRVADALQLRLAEAKPEIDVVPARRKGTAFSPDAPEVVRPIQRADVIYLGAGSPTYAVRQLRGSLAWEEILAAWQQGALLVLASAAAVAVGTFTLPVYEIFKAGEDPEWKPGLDLLAPLGWKLAIVSHWNNAEGGEELDTSRCFIGRERFAALVPHLPPDTVIFGLDEHTAAILDWETGTCAVEGKGTITIRRAGREKIAAAGDRFPLSDLGRFEVPPDPFGIGAAVWEEVRRARSGGGSIPNPPVEVLSLLSERNRHRGNGEFAKADGIRAEIENLGWQVMDTPEGPKLRPKSGG
jgi:hypothetical protein